jgi:hypothetical protein
MEIKPTYVTWEQAKLLKEKGFDEECKFYYDLGFKELTFHVEDTWKNSEIQNGYPNGVFEKLGKYPMISAPEQWKVVEWLRVVRGIWIVVDWMTRTKPYNSGYYCHLRGTSKRLNQDNFIVINDTLNPGYEVFNSPQEAYSAAIDYILKELI